MSQRAKPESTFLACASPLFIKNFNYKTGNYVYPKQISTKATYEVLNVSAISLIPTRQISSTNFDFFALSLLSLICIGSQEVSSPWYGDPYWMLNITKISLKYLSFH